MKECYGTRSANVFVLEFLLFLTFLPTNFHLMSDNAHCVTSW